MCKGVREIRRESDPDGMFALNRRDDEEAEFEFELDGGATSKASLWNSRSCPVCVLVNSRKPICNGRMYLPRSGILYGSDA